MAMNHTIYSTTPQTATSSTTTSKKYKVTVPYFYSDEILHWVRATVVGGYAIGKDWVGQDTVSFVNESDYACYLLKWK